MAQAVAASNGRFIHHHAVVPGTREQVWELLTTRDGLTSFFAPDARVEAVPGGAFEILFHVFRPIGQQGGEGCRFMVLDRARHLRHSWNAPTVFPQVRDRQTVVDWYLADARGGGTEIDLYHYGWETGGEWDEAHAYFEQAWTIILDRLGERLRSGPVDWAPMLDRWQAMNEAAPAELRTA
jgi:uncharacterized protein YndB with AHSA1/START domain